ncbi:AAA-like domain-containing protein [Spirulina sp. 06S082]|uniref:AAA-like domain-containing protein n=1 Tax=Spirulina sp. 06S082 TaxID=3110248 RepID=UPI002B20C4FF|nr:AAA-like domain-containing protein [Spirulina sp. 06S082]MEA5469456.1 AAA-like domain-containing protein [Spirulina sp. 06S082]
MPDFQSPLDAARSQAIVGEANTTMPTHPFSNSSSPKPPLEYPNGPVPLDSLFYIPRPPLEEQAYNEILKPGCVLRIKAPKEMGKSSLLNRVLAHAETLGYYRVNINFQQIDGNDLNKFLRGFCTQVSRGLNLKPNLDEYWDDDVGSKVNCTCYFQWYLLENLDRPVVIALNEVNHLFEYPQIAVEFLPLLRSWHEEAKQIELWSKLRLVVVYSTEIYVPLNINQSPFNVGLPLNIREFTPQQVETLAHLHGLDWHEDRTKDLMALVGGHPLLIRLAFYHLAHGNSSSPENLDQLLEESATEGGIYRNHLRRHWLTLKNDREIARAFEKAIVANQPVVINSILAYKLESLGLVTLKGDKISVRYELYRRYFQQQFLQDENGIANPPEIGSDRLVDLEQQNQKLKQLRNLDELTGLLNRRSFEERLEEKWQQLAQTGRPLSIIVCNIDCFKIFNDVHGFTDGDNCLQLIAGVFEAGIDIPTSEIARYGGDEFIALLPQTDGGIASTLAEKLRRQIEMLGIPINAEKYGGFAKDIVTVSLGVASTMPNEETPASVLIDAASEALYQSKRNGRDRISMSSTLNFHFDDRQ